MIFKVPSNHSRICVSMGKLRHALDGRLPCHAPSQMLTLTSTAQHCRQSVLRPLQSPSVPAALLSGLGVAGATCGYIIRGSRAEGELLGCLFHSYHKGTHRAVFTGSQWQPLGILMFSFILKALSCLFSPVLHLQVRICQPHVVSWQPKGARGAGCCRCRALLWSVLSCCLSFPSLSCCSAQNCSQHLINKCLVIQMTLLPAGGCC